MEPILCRIEAMKRNKEDPIPMRDLAKLEHVRFHDCEMWFMIRGVHSFDLGKSKTHWYFSGDAIRMKELYGERFNAIFQNIITEAEPQTLSKLSS